VIARPRVQGRLLLAAINRPLILVYVGRSVRPCLSALALHCHNDNIYILLIVNWILLLRDFPHQACWKLFQVWEVTIGGGIKLQRTDIVGIEGNVALPSPQPTRESGERR